jgi:hypothetical protein
LLHISANSGSSVTDITFVFNEVGANSKKIAITDRDGVTQCYAEIESWNNAASQANIWFNAPYIHHAENEIFYLYYDNTHADNTTYIGNVNSAVGANVWGGNFLSVWHLSEGTGNGGSRFDSTNTNNDGTAFFGGSGGPTTSGKINGADHYIGVNHFYPDGVGTINASLLNGLNQATISCWVNVDSFIPGGSYPYSGILCSRGSGQKYIIFYTTTVVGEISAICNNGSTYNGGTLTGLSTGTWYYLTMVYSSGSKIKFYKNDGSVFVESSTVLTGAIGQDAAFAFGLDTCSSDRYYNGLLDEVRMQNVIRSVNWIKTDYNSNADTLLIFGSEEENSSSSSSSK